MLCRMSAALSFIVLSACGGGGGSTTPAVEYHDLADPTYKGTTATVTISVRAEPGSLQFGSATYDHASQTILVGGEQIRLSSTGVAADLDNVLAVDDDLSLVGDLVLIAQETPFADLPTNTSVTYHGTAFVGVSDGTMTYYGTMNAAVTVGFDGADMVHINLSEFVPDEDTISYDDSKDALIEFRDLNRDGSRFSTDFSADGATATATGWNGSDVNLLQGSLVGEVGGVLAGPSADEIAGAGYVQGSNGSVLVIFGAQ